ncbi:hypothetical protein U1Q18_033035 [Sarracenia purpurea var. burkii]
MRGHDAIAIPVVNEHKIIVDGGDKIGVNLDDPRLVDLNLPTYEILFDDDDDGVQTSGYIDAPIGVYGGGECKEIDDEY